MVYAVRGALGFQNSARRNNALNFITNRLAVEGLWGPVIAEAREELDLGVAAPSVVCTFRFLDRAARDTFYTDLLAQLTGVNGPVVGSWLERHDCRHDEGGSCVVTGVQRF